VKIRKDTEADWRATFLANASGELHDYGGSVIWFATRWAERMEKAFDQGIPLPECAERLDHEAMQEMGQWSLTGFQYGAAVSTLGQYWVFGDWLRMWHNIHTQLGDEGDKANKGGGTLNPALLNIG
jgi:hypothetical protein